MGVRWMGIKSFGLPPKHFNPSTLFRVTITVMKHYEQKQLREKKVYVAYCFISQFIFTGNQSRNSNRAGSWRQELMQKV